MSTLRVPLPTKERGSQDKSEEKAHGNGEFRNKRSPQTGQVTEPSVSSDRTATQSKQTKQGPAPLLQFLVKLISPDGQGF